MFIEKAKNPEFWRKAANDKRFEYDIRYLKESYEHDTAEPIPVVPYHAIRNYTVTGDRMSSEQPYFRKRRLLVSASILSLLYPENEEYLITLMDVIFAICEEYSWELAAHQPGGIQKAIEDDIDLFAAETGFALSEIYYIMADRFDPMIRERMKKEIERRIIIPFCNMDRKFGWVFVRNNWAAVCGCGVAACFFYLFPERYPEVKERIDTAMRCFLESFADSGVCYEGLLYWQYGFGFYTVYADMLKEYTEGKENCFDNPKVHNIALFPQRMFLTGKNTVCFADSIPDAKVYYGVWHYLHGVYPDVTPVEQGPLPPTDFEGRFCFAMRSFVWRAEENINVDIYDGTFYADDAQWLVRTEKKFGFAAKAGKNREPHNHNDVGSFMFTAGKNRIFTELGSGVYTRQYFNDDYRYDIINCGAFGHSLPIVDGIFQKVGEQYRAENSNFDGKTFSFNIEAAYGETGFVSIVRSFEMTDTGIILRDKYVKKQESLSSCAVERFVVEKKPEICGNQLIFENVTAEFTGGGIPFVTETYQKRHPANIDLTETDEKLWFVDIPVNEDIFTLIVNAK